MLFTLGFLGHVNGLAVEASLSRHISLSLQKAKTEKGCSWTRESGCGRGCEESRLRKRSLNAGTINLYKPQGQGVHW